MTLFNYEHCKVCKNITNDMKTELSKILPANVCNLIGEYNSKCFKCRTLYLKEEEFMKDKVLPDEGLEKFELQLDFFRKMMCSKDPMKFHTQGHPNIRTFHYDKWHRRRIDRLFDEDIVKERFETRRMYYQAMKSYCKNEVVEIINILGDCISIKDLKELKRKGYLPHPNSYWTFRGREYEMRYINAELMELYTDVIIKGYEGWSNIAVVSLVKLNMVKTIIS